MKDNAYKKYIQSLDCCVCGRPAPSEQSHVGSHGTAKRNHDEDSCGMCHNCHLLWHKGKLDKEEMQELAKRLYEEWSNDRTKSETQTDKPKANKLVRN